MIKTLILLSHPNLDESTTHVSLQRAAKNENTISIRHLEQLYPTMNMTDKDIEKEIKLIKKHQRIIFQFPLYWYSTPPTLKYWQDQVLSSPLFKQNFPDLLIDKEIGIITSTDSPEKEFCCGGKHLATIDEILKPLLITSQVLHGTILPTFTIYQFRYLTEDQQMQTIMNYLFYLTGNTPYNFNQKTQWLLKKLKGVIQQETNATQKKQLGLIFHQINEKQERLDSLREAISYMRNQGGF